MTKIHALPETRAEAIRTAEEFYFRVKEGHPRSRALLGRHTGSDTSFTRAEWLADTKKRLDYLKAYDRQLREVGR